MFMQKPHATPPGFTARVCCLQCTLRTSTFHSVELRKEPDTVVPVIPTLRKLRQGDCCESETSLSDIMSSRAWAVV